MKIFVGISQKQSFVPQEIFAKHIYLAFKNCVKYFVTVDGAMLLRFKSEIEQNFDLPEPNRVATISMCIPRSAYKILKENKKLAVMMPLQINVYEEEEQVYITWMNIEMMGKLFGDTVSQVMKEASKGLMTVHKDILLEEGV